MVSNGGEFAGSNSAIGPILNSRSNGQKNGIRSPLMRRMKMTRNGRNMHFYENFGALALFGMTSA